MQITTVDQEKEVTREENGHVTEGRPVYDAKSESEVMTSTSKGG